MSSAFSLDEIAPKWAHEAHEIDRELRKRSKERAREDCELAILLRRGFLLGVHEIGGYGSFYEYAERLFDLTRRQTEERLRIAERLEELPRLHEVFAKGDLTFTAMRELTRVATEENEAQWLAAAEAKTSREIAKMVSGREIGEAPDGPSRPEAQTHRVTLTLSPAAFALLQEVRRTKAQETGGSLDDDALVELLARQALGASDDGRSNYQ